MSLYWKINLVSFSIPFIASFFPPVSFYRQWKYLFPALTLTMIPFILWDVIFTKNEIWGFNEKYISGIHILSLPVEEWAFFFVIPYCCVFVYENIRQFKGIRKTEKAGQILGYLLLVFSLAMAIIGIQEWYTLVNFTFLFVLLCVLLIFKKTEFLGTFFISYMICLVPFFIVNGLLTGSWIEEPVVWYNDNENLSFRMLTIPFEDVFYGLSLVLLNVTLLEYFRGKAGHSE